MNDKNKSLLSDEKMRELFAKIHQPRGKTHQELGKEWEEIKKRTISTSVNPPPQNLKFQLGAALVLTFLFFYTLLPQFRSSEKEDLSRYLIEDSMPFEEESIAFVDRI